MLQLALLARSLACLLACLLASLVSVHKASLQQVALVSIVAQHRLTDSTHVIGHVARPSLVNFLLNI
jgi:hypothetical protein